ncbi:BON domain-containing protein [Maridesulfovibrio zosterae]|uniref:BON domain-containing protein n=1 Tax=Maridesulfovibrio zosterae TaxID=82171 RepID=UPI00040CC9D4|nr:BON domain-containing protein [Maridesulfovibrio zosterae]
MNKHIAIYLILILMAVMSTTGCSTIYKGAMDERSVGQQTSDATISATIMKRYLDDDDVSVLSIEPYTFMSHVYLVGEYDNSVQITKAVSIAQNVEGVKGVSTYLVPKKEDPTCGTTDNLGILASVKKDLIGDGDIWSTNVEVKVVQCKVILLGLVGSQTQLDKSIAHAKAVEGVRGVKSYLKVKK